MNYWFTSFTLVPAVYELDNPYMSEAMNGKSPTSVSQHVDTTLIDPAAPTSTVQDHKVLTVREAAGLLRCSKAHVHHLIRGTVPGVRPMPSLWLGRRRLILRASFEEWLKSSERNPG